MSNTNYEYEIEFENQDRMSLLYKSEDGFTCRTQPRGVEVVQRNEDNTTVFTLYPWHTIRAFRTYTTPR